MEISLPDELQAFAQAESVRRGFKNASDWMQSLLETEKHRQIQQEIESLLLEAADGPFTEWTAEDMNDIRTDGARLIQHRKPH